MILRCTNKLLAALGKANVKLVGAAPSEDDWYANLLWFDRHKCVVIVHAGTLFPVFVTDVRAANLRPIGPWAVGALEGALLKKGYRRRARCTQRGRAPASQDGKPGHARRHERNGIRVRLAHRLGRRSLEHQRHRPQRRLRRGLHTQDGEYHQPLELVRERRWWQAVLPLAIVLPGALAAMLWLRPPYHNVGNSVGPQGIADERGFYVWLSQRPHPVTLADYSAADWKRDGEGRDRKESAFEPVGEAPNDRYCVAASRRLEHFRHGRLSSNHAESSHVSREGASGDADRGSAFSLLSVANATALALGSIGGALIVALAGFEVALLATLIGLVGAGLVATRDAGLHRLPIRARDVAGIADA